MGDIRPESGGAVPPEDGRARLDDLPPLPPGWGTIIVPDDASELATEAEAVRRELRLSSPRARTARAAPDREPASLAVPVVIMVVAVLTTLVSLLAVTLSHRPVPPAPDSTLTNVSHGDDRAPATTGALGQVSLIDPTGAPVRLGTLLPAVIIFVDGCDCARLVLDVARNAPPGVTVIALATSPPVIYGAPTHVRSLAASADSPLRTRLGTGVSAPPNTATAIIVNRHGTVVTVIPGAGTAADIAPLGQL